MSGSFSVRVSPANVKESIAMLGEYGGLDKTAAGKPERAEGLCRIVILIFRIFPNPQMKSCAAREGLAAHEAAMPSCSSPFASDQAFLPESSEKQKRKGSLIKPLFMKFLRRK